MQSSRIDKLSWVPFIICLIAAISDIIGCTAFNIKGFDPLYWKSYANAVYVLWYTFPLIIGLVYYVIIGDLSEALALSIGTLILFAFGWEDFLFYLLSPLMAKLGFPNYVVLHNPFEKIPWLDFPKPAGIAQAILGYQHNNIFLLAINCAIGLLVYTIFFDNMKKLKYKLYIDGLKIEI